MQHALAVALLSLACSAAPAQEAPKTPPAPRAEAAAPETRTTKLADGVTLTADLYRAAAVGGNVPPLLVCLHATRSSRGEYSAIAPELVARGFRVMAVDLRFGGEGEKGNRITKQRSGTRNETWASALALKGREPTAVEAYADLPAVLRFARELCPGSRIGLVGSSYSASLAMVHAAEHPEDVDAVYAFSPGEWIPGWNVAERVKGLAVPCFVTAGTGGTDVEQAQAVLARIAKPPVVYLPSEEGFEGLHGAGTLHQKFERGRAEIWKRFDAALAWLRAPAPAEKPAGN